MKVTYKAKAYLPQYAELKDIAKGKIMPHITLTGDYYASQGMPMIGECEVTITLHSHDQIVQNQITALQAQLQTERANAYRAEQAILERISKLQALTFDGTIAA